MKRPFRVFEIQVFYDVTLCDWLNISQRLEGLQYRHLQDQEVVLFLDCLTLKMTALRSFEAPASVYPTAQSSTPKDSNLQQHRHESL